MADVFGDLSLFAEFDKDREAQGSFIHYDEDSVKSRIVFEDFESDNENDSDDESGAHADDKGESTSAATDTVGKESLGSEMKMEIDADNAEKGKESHPSSNGAARMKKTADQSNLASESEEKEKWLNEQLYAEAAEEASQSNINTHQLIFERNKYRRFAKMLDTSRYVPDEESPAVQLLFSNNSFARKYRQQIEQFIKGLLWEEFHSNHQEPAAEITAKPGVPSCIDINSSLPPEKRSERMRQKHALIGNSQFHKQFLIDFLGWPFTVAEPTRCNVNWEIPLYGQVFNEVYADPSTTKTKKGGQKKNKSACWNCGEDNHAVNECKQPRNPSKIAANRKEFLVQQQQNHTEPKFSGPSRYHMDPELASKYSRFKPGTVSDKLREALGLQEDQLPQHVYKMRLFGYPPGWLAEAKKVQSGMNIFDKNGRVTLITGECLEDGELDDEGAKTEYDINKIIEYPGFTVPVPLGFVEEYETFKMPPIQQHQLKKTLMSQSTEKASAKKRKREKDQEEKRNMAKKTKTEEEEGEEGEVLDEDESTQPLGDDSDTEKETTTPTTPSSNAITAETTPGLNRSSSSTLSISKDYGTPILTREKSDLPDASKFGQGIEDHIPFENLPNSTGTFEKMKGLIELIRNRSKK